MWSPCHDARGTAASLVGTSDSTDDEALDRSGLSIRPVG